MRELRATFSKYLVCAVAAGLASGLGWSDKALAQVDLNIQSRLQTYAIPLAPTVSDILLPIGNIGVCLDDKTFIVALHRAGFLTLRDDLSRLDPPFPPIKTPKDLENNKLYQYFKMNEHKQEGLNILADFMRNPDNVKKLPQLRGFSFSDSHEANIRNILSNKKGRLRFIAPAGVNLCISPTDQPQQTVKFSFPLNPTNESNVLKDNLNNSHGSSFGLGGAAQMITSLPNFDLIALTASSQSVRYDPFSSKSFDAVTAQAAYQFFLGASGYNSHGDPVGPITPTMPQNKLEIPPANMITVQSVALGFQNQTVFMPTFHSESVNLFTPQVSYNAQNIPFAGPQACQAAIPDPRREGFCYAADFSLTVGQTFADVTTQQNANVAVALTPGVRIDHSDWKVTLPITATGRAYENVVGGRDDVLLQVGPAFAYSPPSLYTTPGGDTIAAQFTFSATYNRNYSTLATAAWHGYVALANLTFAVVPASH